MFKNLFILSLMAGGLATATEGFEKAPKGNLTKVDTEYGTLTAEAGNAEIMGGKARTGDQCLHIIGGADKSVSLQLTEKLEKDAPMEYHLERWTNKPPFKVEVYATANGTETKLESLDKLATGSYKHHGRLTLPAGTTALRFTATTADNGGVLLDDLGIFSGDMKIEGVDQVSPVNYPLLKRAAINPALAVTVHAKGSANPKAVQKVTFNVTPGTLEKVTLRSGNDNGTNFRNSVVYGTATPAEDGSVTITCDAAKTLDSGDTTLWIDAAPAAKAKVGGTATFSDLRITIDGQELTPGTEPVTQRIGYMVAVPDETVGNQPDGEADRKCVSFRIPGMIATKKGTLIGCFDARYNNSADLCQDIDVAVVRSKDGGQTWTTPYVGMDSGPGVDNGNGDPCILQDKKGRIWMQSLVCHFKGGASLNVSQTGFDPKKTGQWEMVYSDDEGKTWSKEHVNPTRQIKKEEWTTILAGPGNGICTSKGIIVFPAQIWQRGAAHRCMSTICYSKDGGKNWVYGTGIPHDTSECQVVELQDGSLMLNCRNEKRQGKRIVYVTKDLGKTWTEHESNNKALQEPTCQASLISVDSKKHGKLLIFANPKSGKRNHMTIRASRDGGVTWTDGYEYDSRDCWGYSCLAMCDDNTVGVLYEAPHVSETSDMHGIGFIRIPLETILTGKDVPDKATGKKRK